MAEIRAVPILSNGHPRDTIGAILAAAGDGSPDSTFLMTRRLEQLSIPQLHHVSYQLAHAPRGVSTAVVFETAMGEAAAITPEA